MIQAVLTDWRSAPVSERVRAALGFLERVTLHPEQVGPDDIRAVRAAGVSDAALVDALYICALFNMVDRIADALGFEIPPDFNRGAGTQLRMGYRL